MTRQLQSRGRRVIAVDPDADMINALRRTLPAVQVVLGSAEYTGLPGSVADVVAAGAAYHWFAQPGADRELSRTLKPGGVLALLWNPLHPDDPVQHIFQTARLAAGLEAAEFDPDVQPGRRLFAPVVRRDFTQTIHTTAEDLLRQLASRSYLLSLPEQARSRVLAAAGAELRRLADGQPVTVRYRTMALRTRVLPGNHAERPDFG